MPQQETFEVLDNILKSKEKSREAVKLALQDVLINSVEVFKGIDEYKTLFIQKDEIRSPDFYYKAQDVLSGYYMYLSPIVMVLTALKEVRSNSYFHSTRVIFQKSPPSTVDSKGNKVYEKFVSAPVEKEAEEHVSEETYISAVFVGYLDSCKTAIQTCRNRTKSYDEEVRVSK